RRAAGRRRARPARLVAAGLLGCALAGAVTPLMVSNDAGSAAPGKSPAAGAALPEAPREAATLVPPAAAPREPTVAADDPAANAPAPPALAVTPPKATVHPSAPPAVPRSIQVGAFRDPARAAALRDELARRFEWVMVTQVERDGVVWHRVRVEGLETPRAIADAMAELRRAGHRPIAVRN
ncbi:MAG TPA: SPOR domain-containing protein, partial [Candidatus Limnocylindria bacterium]|nr:SPOR domain-containing protein [Candidatus Limnocylindria bacterium]